MDKLNILGVTISEDMLASARVENLVSVCSRSLFALRVLRAHSLPDEALHSVTRATTIARLMYAAPSWWGITAEKDRAKIERLYNRLKRMGYLPADAPRIPALVDKAEASLFRSAPENLKRFTYP